MEKTIKFIQPLPQHMRNYIAQVNGVRICICLNTEDILQHVLQPGTYWEADSDKTESVECTLYLIQTDTILPQYTVHQDHGLDVRDLPKTAENCPNAQYTLGELTIKLFSYPNHSVHIETCDHSNITVLAGDQYVLTFYLKEYIKRIVSWRIGLHRLHASAVARQQGAVAFLGPGNAGKSTISYNLTMSGWTMLHDDLLFLDTSADKIFIQGIQVNPCLRRAALPYTIGGSRIIQSRDVFCNCYHECYYLCNIKLMQEPVLLKAILLLSEGTLADGKPTPVRASSLQALRAYVTDPVSLEQIRDVPVYEVGRNVPVKQINRFLEDLLEKC